MTDREKAVADAALRGMHTFPIERRLDPAEFTKVQTMTSTAIGRDDFDSEEEWRDFLRYLGLGNVPAGFRISLSPAGDQRLTGDDVERVEISTTVTFG